MCHFNKGECCTGMTMHLINVAALILYLYVVLSRHAGQINGHECVKHINGYPRSSKTDTYNFINVSAFQV